MDKAELADIISELDVGIVELTVGLESLQELVEELRRVVRLAVEDEDER